MFEHVEHSPLQLYPTYVADTPGKRVALELLNGHSESEIARIFSAPGVETVGFRVDDWDPARPSVTVVTRTGDHGESLRGWSFELTRVAGDWRVRLDDAGVTGDASPVDPGDYTPWW